MLLGIGIAGLAMGAGDTVLCGVAGVTVVAVAAGLLTCERICLRCSMASSCDGGSVVGCRLMALVRSWVARMIQSVGMTWGTGVA